MQRIALIRRTLENFADEHGNLPFICDVELRQEGRWVSEARGSSVAWLVSAADDASDFGRVQIRTQYGNVIA